MLAAFIVGAGLEAQQSNAGQEPPRARAARRFLARRGWTPEAGIATPKSLARAGEKSSARALFSVQPMSSPSTVWSVLGPVAVSTSNYGLVTGRITALALDPNDATGNKLYVGTTGGGVWTAQNAATATVASVSFTPLTDTLSALSGATDASISIGALAIQPGSGGVILAGTGDTNDMLDSYYGAGILRSTDGGNTWTLVTSTNDVASNLGTSDYTFAGEGFSGIAWSTINSQLVVAAVSQAYGGAVRNSVRAGKSYQGLYFSTDAGATWHQATIMDGTSYVQGPLVSMASPDGNGATSVVWNPVRKIFVAAVRYHGYYQSSDGKTWTRMSSQPGSNLTTTKCPTNLGGTGSTGCPIYRGTLAVNPSNGDTFAWTVDAANLDQGIWQDACTSTSTTSGCVSPTMSFSKQWSTAALESTVSGGTTGIANGSYTLALAAVPQNQDTILLAGANDLWRCSLAAGCVWRNTTNTSTCSAAGVAPYQHTITFSANNPLEVFVGNDSGLWRSLDGVGQTGSTCAATDASHFQNMNSALGSLSDVESVSPVFTTPYSLMAGLGVNGTAGVKAATTSPTWPQILGGYGGPVDIDASNTSNWYVNAQTGVGIFACTQSAACTPSDFGSSPAISSTQVSGDGAAMDTPAPFLVDPLDSTQLLIGTCRVWRGTASGSGWSSTNALSTVLDGGSPTGACQGDGTINTMAAQTLSGGGEVIYVGMRGAADGGGNLAGHVFKATVTPPVTGTVSWTDITSGSITNDSNGLNAFGYTISSIYIDPHDTSGNTVYVTVEGIQTPTQKVRTVYGTTDGGTSWTDLTANLPASPANSVLVDPQDSGTVYVATDVGVYSTSNLGSCTQTPYTCWSIYGSGLPEAPVVALRSTMAGVSNGVLVAGTYGRGTWSTALSTAGTTLTDASVTPSALNFGSQAVGTAGALQTVTLLNTGTLALTPTSISIPSAYLEQDTCVGKTLSAGGSCTIQVSFDPTSQGTQNGTMVIKVNVIGGQLTVALTGTGTTGGTMTSTPTKIDFGPVEIGTTSAAQSAMIANTGSSAVSMNSATTSAPFSVSSDLCSGSSLATSSACQIKVLFAPTVAGAVIGSLTVVDSGGTQTVMLSGTGASAATDTLSTSALSFSATGVGSLSLAQPVTLTNSGGMPLKSIAISVSGAFQESDTCGGQLAGTSTCTISVVFAPTQTGNLTGTLTIADAGKTQTVALNGLGVAPPAFSVSPTSLTFTNLTVGVASAAQTVTISNTGALPIANVGFQITGAAASSYALASNSCSTTLAAGASCAVGVTFTPTGTSSISAVLSISSSAANVQAVAVPLNGSSLTSGALTASPSQVSFGAVVPGQAAAQTVTFTNSSAYSIAAPAVSVTSPFTLATNTCLGTIAAGGNCSVAVNFAPTTAGSYNGTLTATSTSLAQPLTVPVSGAGFDFTVVPPSAVTVAAGQTASFTISINTISGASGNYSYTYACGTLPTYALCTFSPTSITMAAGVTGYVGISISTGKATAALNGGPAKRLASPLYFALLLLPLSLAKRRRKALTMLVLLLVAALALSGCASAGLSSSGGSSGSGSGKTTPAGTYTIPVTVTSSGISHTVNLTLTVV